MDAVLGYAFLDASYHDSPYYHEGSAPMNTAAHTANGWFITPSLRNTQKPVVGSRVLLHRRATICGIYLQGIAGTQCAARCKAFPG